VTCQMISEEKADFEAILATAALIQNFQLLAWEQKIGVTWRTTPNIFDLDFQAEMGLARDEKIVGVLQLTQQTGKIPHAKKRQPLATWVQPLMWQEEAQ